MASELEISIVALKFNFLDDDQAVAIPMSHPIAPEYPPRNRTSVAYARTNLPAEVKIYCNFKAIDAGFTQSRSTSTVSVRAVIGGSTAAIVVGQKYFGWLDLFSYSNPDIGFIPFLVDTSILFGATQAIGVYSSEWEWQWAPGLGFGPDAEWKPFATTTIEFLLTLDKPSQPWGCRLHPNDLRRNVLIPYDALVRHACTWAQGATTEVDACALITKGFMEQTRFQYSASNAYTDYEIDPTTNCPISPEKSPDFQVRCSAIVDRLHGWDGRGKQANCADMAHVLMLLANTIGCKLSVGRLENSSNPKSVFKVNEVNPLRCAANTAGEWMFHMVAYLGDAFDAHALIFDACLQFPNGTDTPDYVLGMPLPEYIQKLAQNPADCIPQQYATQERIHLI
jgi:hypothetical protein